ncbi:MAG: hypothetical protein J5915_08615 [Acidaminococcaceae bacterium]|nr:hypothetical protein [Acidaminococcaceae bacterium]MBQ5345055.1 hypothetical protein [Acidaminococcaceae bacterium]
MQVGSFKTKIISLLGLDIEPGTPIFLGESNMAHIQRKHPAEYEDYLTEIPHILDSPDYVGVNTKDDSIEFVKEYKQGNDFLKVAVRVSVSGKYFARSIYTLNSNRVQNYIAKGTLKSV